ncbi:MULTISPECIES: hypothetical protein [Roseivirga]|uniref:ATP synthase subunit I n=1 Tax=Roseivirga thermotolerans TaxID=1758176 RepID=A0ABQ3I4R9_9BACT|nr:MULTISPECIES: hypothetical protein [Roseivirga]MEC7752839.1 hypothetical protein [Bacteroidota bacterium]GHE54173.1 hypothetical protein GCM10011340_05940 [Roseivirga thermotolerans]|tara:strand:+ start:3812 stop:4219 length:408 start_codon:yes stop_codon:yes gene_type:complete
MKSLGRQIVESLVFSLVLCGLVLLVQQIGTQKPLVHPYIWSIMVFSGVLGMIVVAIAHWGMSTMDAQSRPNIFLGLTVLRMLLSMAFIGITLYMGIEDRVLWVVNFFAVYLFYLVFEITTILSNLRAISGEGEKQ